MTEVRFTDNGDGTISDHKTGLMWEKATRGGMPWQDAMDSCAALSLAGYTDWRLPCIEELLSIVDFGRSVPACNPVFKARSDRYWSSTTYLDFEDSAWFVSFYDGGTYAGTNTYCTNVRAVRSEQ